MLLTIDKLMSGSSLEVKEATKLRTLRLSTSGVAVADLEGVRGGANTPPFDG